MRKAVLMLILLVSVGFGGSVFAQETESLVVSQAELPEPGLTPDSPFYFLKMISERIGTFFTFGDVAKAERYAQLAAMRVAEAKAVVDKGKPEAAEKALTRYQEQLEKALAKIEQAQVKGKNISGVTETIARATATHLIVLEEVLERVPEQAKEALIRAKEVSVTGQQNALRNLAGENPEKATEINLKAAEARLNKARFKAEEGEAEDAEEAVKEFANQYKFGEEISEIARELGKDTVAVEQLVGKATVIHLEVLAEVYEKVPEQAKLSIEKAMEVSVKGHEKAVEVLREKNDMGEVLEAVPMPEAVPGEVRERIKERVRQEIIKEKEELEEAETSGAGKLEVEKVKIQTPAAEKSGR